MTKVCQISIIVDENAGSKDSTKFSVESGNVVVTYGYQTGSTGYKRYLYFLDNVFNGIKWVLS